MINYDKLTQGLIQSIGLRKTSNPDYPEIPSSLLFKQGKVLINHPLINIENLAETAGQFSDYEYPDYDNTVIYGDKFQVAYITRVTGSDGNVYEFVDTTPQSGVDPIGDVTGTWELLNALGLYLEDVFKNSAYELISDVMTRKANRYETKSLLQYEKLYQGQGRITDKVLDKGALVGFEITPKRNENIAVIIKDIGTHFDSATSVDFYLFHTGSSRPVKTFTLNHSSANDFQWNKLTDELILPYVDINNNIDAGGSFFLLYDQAQVTGLAINKNYDFYKNCSYCSQYDNLARTSRQDFYFIRAVEIPANSRLDDGSGNELLFDINSVREKGNTTYGLNLSVQAKCDLTDLIIDVKEDLANVLATKVKINLMKEFAYNTRVNGIEERVRKQSSFALQDKHIGGEGLLRQYDKEVDQLDFDLSNLNSRCLPKKKAGRGIRTSTNAMYRG